MVACIEVAAVGCRATAAVGALLTSEHTILRSLYADRMLLSMPLQRVLLFVAAVSVNVGEDELLLVIVEIHRTSMHSF